MNCPKCDQPNYHPPTPCPKCQFAGNPDQLEVLGHIQWLLGEINTWQTLGINEINRQRVGQHYQDRRQELEVELGLRLPRFSQVEAQEAWPDLFQRERLLRQIGEWHQADLLKPNSTQTMVEQATKQVRDLREQLAGHTPPLLYPTTDQERLQLTDFLLKAVDYLQQNDGFKTAVTETIARSRLLAEKERLEIKLGLRPKPEPVITETGSAEIKAQPTAPTPPPKPKEPALPWRERLWHTLLSERTLHALLILGIFLLFTAAISFVVWGWQNFSAPLRVAIPSGFTGIFFGLGWYVRTKTPLYRSGIALSAIAALLIPIDFYTIYANFDIPPNIWPTFWLITSLFCVGAYIIATLVIRSRFFGYLVATAAGSTVLALIEVGHQLFGLSHDWRTAGLSLLALTLTLVSHTLSYYKERKWYIFAQPFHTIALFAVGVIMPLTFAWRYLGRNTYDTLHYALILNWWLGGLIFGWGAVHHRSRNLGILAAIALPVATYLTQAALFDQFDISPAWHAFGLAALVPLYFLSGHTLSKIKGDFSGQHHHTTATRGGVILLLVAALWPVMDLNNGIAAASSHFLLTGAVVQAALLWRRPAYLYGASVLSLSATTFVMTELQLDLSQLSVGWISLAIAHLIIALNLGTRFPLPLPNYAKSLVIAGYTIAGLALLPPLFPYDGQLLAYALGNWLGMAAWGARLTQTNHPSFALRNDSRKSIFHWLTALPLPVWVWLLFANRGPLDFNLPLALAVLAWGLIFLSYRLGQIQQIYRWPWYLTGLVVSVIAPVVAFNLAPNGFTPALTLLLVGLLYFADAVSNHQRWEFIPAGLVTAWGYSLLLDKLSLSFDAISFGLSVLIAVYLLTGLWSERQKSLKRNHDFLAPLYLTTHALTLFVLWGVYLRPFEAFTSEAPWTDPMRLWGAAAQLFLGVAYGLYAWSIYKERWSHFATWLGAAGGGFIAIAYSTGRGSSAATAALIAIVFILAERGLNWLCQQPRFKASQQEFIRLIWHLYRRPFLITGWVVSAGVIALALIRNLWLLGGGRTQQIWAMIGLLLITGLYALSARLFRRARFVWLAAILVFAPWTILTNLGWFSGYYPTLPGFALSWGVLAWSLYLLSLALNRLTTRAYALPLRVVAHTLLPLALLWGVADVDTSRFTFILAIGLYILVAFRDHHTLKNGAKVVSTLGQTKFFYPALGLIPVWFVYLMAWLLPTARHEHYGLMLILFGPLGLLLGQWLKSTAPTPAVRSGYALPAYLTGYIAVIVGTLLVAHEPALLALVLLFDALLLVASAWLFQNALWVYPAALVTPLSLLLALNEAGIASNRHGWTLIGLASIYLAFTWVLRRANLPAYSGPPLIIGLALIALSLPYSSQDQIGALGGYGGAALLYGLTAFWLRQPLLLTPACAVFIVPYAVALQRSGLDPKYYGVALFPGAIAVLALGWGLDRHFGAWRDFPWSESSRWAKAIGDRLLGWWGLPLYTLGFGLATVSPFFTQFEAGLSALNFLLLMPVFGWAIYRFRLRVWLFATALAGHFAAIFFLGELGWWRYPASVWLRFLPVTLITALVALFIERYRREGSPLNPERMFAGWSRVLYIILLFDIIIAQLASFEGSLVAAIVTLIHTLLIATLASFWLSRSLPYLSTTLGMMALIQWLSTMSGPIERLPILLSLLILGYGVVGYGLTWLRFSLADDYEVRPWLAIWELSLQRSSMLFSLGTLVLTAWLGLDLVGWTVRALFGLPFRHIVDLATVQMGVGVFALLGLLYLAAAFTQRWLGLGYVAMGMLLVSWLLQSLYIQQWENIQFYTIPAGLYLLGIAYVEYQRGHKAQGQWLDYVGLALMMGSLFWQTMLFGWGYAFLLGLEGAAAFWWGSARRLRRFLYAGMVAVILATIGQLINALWSINQWIVFGAIGLLLVLLALFIERKLDDIKIWQASLEAWE